MRETWQSWNWLPSFRVVAETEHLPTASKQLDVSPSALSRTIQLLEKELGRQLFIRRGRRLELNDDGRRLLTDVREAMLIIDRGVQRSVQGAGPHKISIASESLFAEMFLLPIVEAMTKSNPGTLVALRATPSNDESDVLEGRVDMAILIGACAHEWLEIDRIGTLAGGVFCGRGHPLFDKDGVTMADIVASGFIAPEPTAGASVDGWPAHMPRTIAVHGGLEMMQAYCARGKALAALPDFVANRTPSAFRKLPVDFECAFPIHAVRRKNAGVRSAALESVVSALRRAIEDHVAHTTFGEEELPRIPRPRQRSTG